MLPPLLPIGFSSILYLFLGYILLMGFWQLYATRANKPVRVKSLVPLGGAAVALGIIGFIQHYRMALQTIQEAGDISPDLVANSFTGSYAYPTLGLLCLTIAFVFRYVNGE